MKIKINKRAMKQLLRKSGFSYSDLEGMTGININRWKHILNKGGYVTEAEIAAITDIVQCDHTFLRDPDFQLKQNAPLEIEIMVRKLYERRKGDIQPVYEHMIRDFQKTGKLECFIGEANRLLSLLFSGDDISVDPLPALNIIVDEFQKDRILSGSRAELTEDGISCIFSIMNDSLWRNSAMQALAFFLYALVLFDVVFLEESMASVTQFTTERFGGKAEQYSLLTSKIEILRNTLLRYMNSKSFRMDDAIFEGATEEIMSGVHLMLLACYKAGQHLNGDYLSSEYVNRPELDAIITRLTRIIKDLGIEVPETFPGIPGARFFKHLALLSAMFKSKKPKKNTLTYNDGLRDGYFLGVM